jgi:1,4-alpha-glucan branching enzyme
VIVFERGGLVFVFNFHTHKSYTDYRIGVEVAGEYRLVLDSDSRDFMGHGRLDPAVAYFTQPGDWDGRRNSMQVYIPCRTAIVLGTN